MSSQWTLCLSLVNWVVSTQLMNHGSRLTTDDAKVKKSRAMWWIPYCFLQFLLSLTTFFVQHGSDSTSSMHRAVQRSNTNMLRSKLIMAPFRLVYLVGRLVLLRLLYFDKMYKKIIVYVYSTFYLCVLNRHDLRYAVGSRPIREAW